MSKTRGGKGIPPVFLRFSNINPYWIFCWGGEGGGGSLWGGEGKPTTLGSSLTDTTLSKQWQL